MKLPTALEDLSPIGREQLPHLDQPTTADALPMKVLLRNVETGLFYAAPDQWTQQHADALDFKTPDVALDQVAGAKLAAMEIVMHFEEAAFDVPLTIVSTGK